MTKYTTIQGDAWDGISFKLYGDEKLSAMLIQANQEHSNIVIFPGGIVLSVPSKPVDDSNDLPPWKRGVADG